MNNHGNPPASTFDTATANMARVYDYLLGGKDNLRADREAAKRLADKAPEVYQAVRANRAFLVRAVRYLAEHGVRQFLDLGSGFPTSPNVHEVARTVHPDARVVYVDHDPVVVAHGRAMHGVPGVAVAHADLRDPDQLLDARAVRELIDWDRPVGVLAVAVLHFVTDDEAAAVVARLREAAAAGSYLALTHASPGRRGADIDDAAEAYRTTTADIWVRSPGQIRGYLDGLEVVDPGLVPAQRWRPTLPLVLEGNHLEMAPVADDEPQAMFLAAVARVLFSDA